MTSIIPFAPALRAHQAKRKLQEQYRQKKALEMTMKDSLDNMEELQHMTYQDLPLMGIESFEIIELNDNNLYTAYH